jgi:hypothetical protein
VGSEEMVGVGDGNCGVVMSVGILGLSGSVLWKLWGNGGCGLWELWEQIDWCCLGK